MEYKKEMFKMCIDLLEVGDINLIECMTEYSDVWCVNCIFSICNNYDNFLCTQRDKKLNIEIANKFIIKNKELENEI